MVTAASADTGMHVYCKWLKLAKLAQCIAHSMSFRTFRDGSCDGS